MYLPLKLLFVSNIMPRLFLITRPIWKWRNIWLQKLQYVEFWSRNTQLQNAFIRNLKVRTVDWLTWEICVTELQQHHNTGENWWSATTNLHSGAVLLKSNHAIDLSDLIGVNTCTFPRFRRVTHTCLIYHQNTTRWGYNQVWWFILLIGIKVWKNLRLFSLLSNGRN